MTGIFSILLTILVIACQDGVEPPTAWLAARLMHLIYLINLSLAVLAHPIP